MHLDTYNFLTVMQSKLKAEYSCTSTFVDDILAEDKQISFLSWILQVSST